MCGVYFSALNWKNYASNEEIWLKYPFIALHAVSRDATVFPFKPCVYLLYSVPEEDDSEQEVVTTYRLATQELDQRGLLILLYFFNFILLFQLMQYLKPFLIVSSFIPAQN